MSTLDKIYRHCPIFLQNIMCTAKGWQIKRRRFNSQFFSELRRYENGDYNQEEELCRFLKAIRNTPAYRDFFSTFDVDALQAGSGRVYDLLKQLPVINKDVVKQNLNAYVNPDFHGRQFEMHTSGTTGGGITFPYSVEMENRQWAVWWRYRRRLGIELDTWSGWFGGKPVVDQAQKKPPYWRTDYAGRKIMFSVYHATEENIGCYYEKIKASGLTWLHGYPSYLTRLSHLIINAGLTPLNNIKHITTGSENLLPNEISLMQQVFPQAIIRTHYGLAEGVANLSQDKEGVWQVDDDFAFTELIPVEGDENKFRIVGTGFSNLAFPLLRYDTNDIVTTDNGTPPRIVSIDGRGSDVIRFTDGKESRIPTILGTFTNIVESQFHQRKLNEVEIHVVKGSAYTDADEKRLGRVLGEWLPGDMSYRIIYVDKVERTKSGKIRTVISELNRGENNV